MGNIGLDLENGLFLGIDFGTTNSVVSMFNVTNGEVQTIAIDGGNIFPSAIQFETDQEDHTKLSRIFGAQAKEAAIIYPQSTVLSVKRLLGGDEKIRITVDSNDFSFEPEQIAGEIIGYLKQRSDEYLQEELNISAQFTGCVVTVPANSTDKQKKKTKQALILAGFDESSVHLRLEPAAAAISYAIGETQSKTVLVYDFGGGTFDACILSVEVENVGEPKISIMATNGDNDLGGNDVDKIIMDMIYEEFKKLTNGEIDLFNEDADDGVSKRQKKVAIIRLSQMANQAKERLSSAKSTKVVLAPFLQEPKIININMEISREDFFTHKRINRLGDTDAAFSKFEGKTLEDIINMTFSCVDSCLKAAELNEKDINQVFLVGGSSSITFISEKIAEKFGEEPFRSKISPALSISQGAAYYSNMITIPTINGPNVVETTVHPLGLEISGRRFLEIVKAGQVIPQGGLVIEAEETLTTNFDNVTSMAIVVYENTVWGDDGETKTVNQDGMKRLAGTQLRGIPKGERGREQVKVLFNISQDNMLKVTAQSCSESGIITELSVDELY